MKITNCPLCGGTIDTSQSEKTTDCPGSLYTSDDGTLRRRQFIVSSRELANCMSCGATIELSAVRPAIRATDNAA